MHVWVCIIVYINVLLSSVLYVLKVTDGTGQLEKHVVAVAVRVKPGLYSIGPSTKSQAELLNPTLKSMLLSALNFSGSPILLDVVLLHESLKPRTAN